MTPMPKHTDAVVAALASLVSDRETLLAGWKAMIGGDGALMFPLDLLASGAVKRAVSAISAMKLLVESWKRAVVASHAHRHCA
jgi:hypothetical protein